MGIRSFTVSQAVVTNLMILLSFFITMTFTACLVQTSSVNPTVELVCFYVSAGPHLCSGRGRSQAGVHNSTGAQVFGRRGEGSMVDISELGCNRRRQEVEGVWRL